MPTLAAIEYLNARPFFEAFRTGEMRFPGAIRWGRPRAINRMLISGEADLGVLSTLEWARRADDFLLIDRITVTSNGPVRSIRLYRLTESDPPRKVNVTPESETAAALVPILYPGVTIGRFEPSEDAFFQDADAALLIGDEALAEDRPYLDLGEAWTKRTGLPFVWAVGVVRREALRREPTATAQAIEVWKEAAARGEELTDRIAEGVDLPRDFVHAYLAAFRRAGRDPRRWDGLARFLQEAHGAGVLPAVPRPAFYAPSLGRA